MKGKISLISLLVLTIILTSCSNGFDRELEQKKAEKKLNKFSDIYSKEDDETNKLLFTSKANKLDKVINKEVLKKHKNYFSKNYKDNVLKEVKSYKNHNYDEIQETSSNTFYLEVLPYGDLKDKEYKVLPNHFEINKESDIQFDEQEKCFLFPVEISDQSANQKSSDLIVKMIKQKEKWVIDEVTFKDEVQSDNDSQSR
ncbi:hypothetical protein [Mammaliicoccus sciuri]|uniref:hypothetical protein n=1 Tax=Mammaliicoccus sciuri TaxID=1296 RepID=UPI001F40EF79|nr:hypothetical protein [Mammaliicoccus sciuri]MCE5086057.1 hypothetical protein [Mammaliicoccus sciuri]